MKIKEISAGETYIENDAYMHTATIDIVYDESESKEIDAIECHGDGKGEAEILRDHVLLCVSMHDELVEALREAYRYGSGDTGCDSSYLPPGLRAKMLAVLAKLESSP